MNSSIKFSSALELTQTDLYQQQDAIFMTGATGFLGGHFLFWKLHTAGQVYVLVRGENEDIAKRRVLANLELCADSYNFPMLSEQVLEQRLKVIPGDLRAENLALSATQFQHLCDIKISEIWHFAASLSYRWDQKQSIDATNLFGTEQLLKFAKELGRPRFIYISTAYTAGKQSGLISESLHPSDKQPSTEHFNNYYEQSKCLAEQRVQEMTSQNNLACTIVRPSIILGPELTKVSGGTRFGLYGFCQEMYQMRHTLAQVKKKLRLIGDINAVANFIAVDQVVQDLLYLRAIDYGKQTVYHSTGPEDLSLYAIIKLCEQYNGIDCITFAKQRESKVSSFEALFDSKTQFYEGYYRTQKSFTRSLPAHRKLTLTDIEQYVRLYVEELKAEESGSVFTRHQLESWDGTPICAYTLGVPENPCIVIANAFGMPKEFITPLAQALSQSFFVVTWDTRWVPALTVEFEIEKCNTLTHAKDLISLLDFFSLDSAAIVGWSSGVQTCLRTVNQFKERISCAILLNGGISLKTAPPTPITEFESHLKTLLPKISANRRMAEFYCQLIYGNVSASQDNEQAVDSILTSTDPYLLHMTSMPFRSVESLYRYANMMDKMFNEREDAFTTGVDTPVLVFGCEHDEVTHPELAKALADRLSNSHLVIQSNAGHFAQYYDPGVAELCAQFVHSNLAVNPAENH